MRRSVVAVGAGAALAWILASLARWLLWPRLIGGGLLDLDQPVARIGFMLVGTLPVVAGGFVAGRLAPRDPLRHGLAAGVLLLIPFLFDLPRILSAYREVPQPMWPLVATLLLRPLGGMAGAYLTVRARSDDRQP
jgi:hypothetical protein